MARDPDGGRDHRPAGLARYAGHCQRPDRRQRAHRRTPRTARGRHREPGGGSNGGRSAGQRFGRRRVRVAAHGRERTPRADQPPGDDGGGRHVPGRLPATGAAGRHGRPGGRDRHPAVRSRTVPPVVAGGAPGHAAPARDRRQFADILGRCAGGGGGGTGRGGGCRGRRLPAGVHRGHGRQRGAPRL